MKRRSFFVFLFFVSLGELSAQCGEVVQGNNGVDTLEFEVIPGKYVLSVYTEHVPDCIQITIGNQPQKKICFGQDCLGTQGTGISLDSCVSGPVLWQNGFGPIPQSWSAITSLGYKAPIAIVDTGGVGLIIFTVPPDVCRVTVAMISNPGNTIWAYRLVCPEGLPTPIDTVLVENTSCNLDSVGVMVVHATTENGCAVDSITIVDYAPLETEVQTTTCYPDSVGSQVNTYITEYGCDSIVTTEVTFIDTCNQKKICDIYVPNAFSPNGDGVNDIFYIQSGDCVKKISRFLVFDRWGGNVFEKYNFQPNDPQFGWDGTTREKILNSATFVWFAEVIFKDESVKLFKGGVTLH